MEQDLIPTIEFCNYYQVEDTFIHSLERSGLIKIITIEQTSFINTNELNEVEKFIRLHYDLDINLQGIEAIMHLLHKIDSMKQEITHLKNQLHLHDPHIPTSTLNT